MRAGRGDLSCVFLISPLKIPAGRVVLGVPGVDLGVVIFNGFPVERESREKREREEEEEKRERKRAV